MGEAEQIAHCRSSIYCGRGSMPLRSPYCLSTLSRPLHPTLAQPQTCMPLTAQPDWPLEPGGLSLQTWRPWRFQQLKVVQPYSWHMPATHLHQMRGVLRMGQPAGCPAAAATTSSSAGRGIEAHKRQLHACRQALTFGPGSWRDNRDHRNIPSRRWGCRHSDVLHGARNQKASRSAARAGRGQRAASGHRQVNKTRRPRASRPSPMMVPEVVVPGAE